MKNSLSPTITGMRTRTWLGVGMGLLVGVVSLFVGQMIDDLSIGRTPDAASLFGYYALAAAAFAVAYFPAVQAMFLTHSDLLGVDWTALHLSTVGFGLFLIPTLVVAPDSTGRWLPCFFAASIVIGWLASQLPIVSRTFSAWIDRSPREADLSGLIASVRRRDLTGLTLRPQGIRNNQATSPRAYRLIDWGRMPYAPFVAVALVLLIASPVCSALDQPNAAIQLANWAYEFLLLAILGASLSLFANKVISRGRLEPLSRFVLPIAALAFFPLALFFDANSSTPAEKVFITDVYPNFLAQQLAPGDMVISDSPALRLGSMPRIAPSVSLDPDQRGQALWDDLARTLDTQRRLLWINVPGQSRDTHGTLATFLRANGCLDYVSDTSLPVKVFELNQPFARPSVLSPFWAARTSDAFDPATVNFGPIEITGTKFERRACSHDSVAVDLRWVLPGRTSSQLKLSLLLDDAKARRIQTQDFYIDDASQHHTDRWLPGASVPAYYVLMIPLGTPPGLYTLSAAVYPASQPQWLHVNSAVGLENRGDHIELGTVQVYRAQDVSADPWKTRSESGLLPANVEMVTGLTLDGYNVADPTVIPGESLHLALRWRATKDALGSYIPKAALRRGDKIIAEASGVPVDGTYPTDQWKSGEYVTERREVRVPPESLAGPARLEASIQGGQTAYLADINIEPITRTFQMPAVGHSASATFEAIGDLVGYDLPDVPLTTNQQLDVTFYWQASGTAGTDYTVFAQLLAADGHLIAQSDSQPGQGRHPTRSWLPGEIVTDPHSLEFIDHNYQGEAKLIVGLYDAETGERVPIDGATDNFFLVPARMQVVGR